MPSRPMRSVLERGPEVTSPPPFTIPRLPQDRQETSSNSHFPPSERSAGSFFDSAMTRPVIRAAPASPAPPSIQSSTNHAVLGIPNQFSIIRPNQSAAIRPTQSDIWNAALSMSGSGRDATSPPNPIHSTTIPVPASQPVPISAQSGTAQTVNPPTVSDMLRHHNVPLLITRAHRDRRQAAPYPVITPNPNPNHHLYHRHHRTSTPFGAGGMTFSTGRLYPNRIQPHIPTVTYYKHLHESCHICLLDFEDGQKVT